MTETRPMTAAEFARIRSAFPALRWRMSREHPDTLHTIYGPFRISASARRGWVLWAMPDGLGVVLAEGAIEPPSLAIAALRRALLRESARLARMATGPEEASSALSELKPHYSGCKKEPPCESP